MFIKYEITEKKVIREILAKIYCVNKFDGKTFRLAYKMIHKYQQRDQGLISKIRYTNYHTKYGCGSRKGTQIICISDLFLMKNYILNGYCMHLMNPVRDRTEATISQQ